MANITYSPISKIDNGDGTFSYSSNVSLSGDVFYDSVDALELGNGLLGDLTVDANDSSLAVLSIYGADIDALVATGVLNLTLPAAVFDSGELPDGVETPVSVEGSGETPPTDGGETPPPTDGGETPVEDVTAPDAPVINALVEGEVIDASEIRNGVTITGTAEAGSVVTLTLSYADTVVADETPVFDETATDEVAADEAIAGEEIVGEEIIDEEVVAEEDVIDGVIDDATDLVEEVVTTTALSEMTITRDVIADENGEWSYELTADDYQNGELTITAVAADEAGNISQVSEAVVVTVNAAADGLNYSSDTVTEATDGSIAEPITLTLGGDFKFASDVIGEDLNADDWLVGAVSGVPTGLTAKLMVVDDTTATLSFEGNATDATSLDDVDVQVSLLETYFEGSVAPENADYTIKIAVPSLTSTGSFEESKNNDGTITNTSKVTFSLKNDAFASDIIGTDLGDLVENVPAGLTAHLVILDANTAELSLEGAAEDHTTDISGIDSLVVAFDGTHFVSGEAPRGAEAQQFGIDFVTPTLVAESAVNQEPGATLDGHVATFTLTDASFARAGLNLAKFVEAPEGVTVESFIVSEDRQSAVLTLSGEAVDVADVAEKIAFNLPKAAFENRMSVTNARGEIEVTFEDNTPPAAPVFDVIGTEFVVSDAEREAGVVISGTGEEGSFITLTIGDNTKEPIEVVDGVWSYTATGLNNGDYTISAVATDAAGNVNEDGAQSITLTLEDTTAPVAPIVAPINEANAINIANKDEGVVVQGTAEADSEVVLTFADNTTESVSVDSLGNWFYPVDPANVENIAGLKATAVDAAGNSSEPTDTTFVVDIQAPVVTDFKVDGDNNVSDEERGSLTVSGTGEAGSTITLTFGTDGSVTVADESAADEITDAEDALLAAETALADAQAAFDLAQADLDALDGTDAAALEAATLALDDATATLESAQADYDAASATLDEVTAAVEITADETVDVTTTSVDPAVTEAEDALAAAETALADAQAAFDLAQADVDALDGTDAAALEEATLALDDATATLESAQADYDAAAVALEEVIAATETPTDEPEVTAEPISVPAIAEAEEALLAAEAALADAQTAFDEADAALAEVDPADAAALEEATLALDDATATLESAQADFDAATAAYDEALAAAETPVDETPVDETPVDETPVDETPVDETPVTSEIVDVLNTVTVTVGEDGTWSYALTANDLISGYGSQLITAVETDLAGNASEPSTIAIELQDTTAPKVLVVDSVTRNGIISKAEKEDGVAITGTTEANAVVTVAFNDGSTVTANADADGRWSYDLTEDNYAVAENNVLSLSVVATDAAGNATEAVVLDVDVPDTIAPVAPVLTADENPVVGVGTVLTGSIDAADAADATITLTFGEKNTVTGIVPDAEGKWEYEVQAGDFYTIGIDNSGKLAVVPVTSITAKATDTAGNVSDAVVFEVPVPPTTTPTIESVDGEDANGFVSISERADLLAVVKGTAEAGATIKLTFADASEVEAAAVADADGNWSYTLADADYDNLASITATATLDGKQAATSEAFTEAKADFEAPDAPTVEAPADAVIAGNEVVLTGTATVGDSVKLSIDGGDAVDVTVEADGTWTYTLATSATAAAALVVATSFDEAGNSTASDPLAITLAPASAPNAPELPVVAGDANADGILNIAEAGNTVTVTSALNGAFASDTAELFINGSTTALTGTVDAVAQVATFSVPVASLTDGADNTFAVKLTNAIGSADGVAAATIKLDVTAPAAPVADSVLAGKVIVTGLEVGALWSYSTDGVTYSTPVEATTTEGSIADLAKGTTIAAGSLHVKQTDVAGNSTDNVNAGDLLIPAESIQTAVSGAGAQTLTGNDGAKDVFILNYTADANGAFGDFGQVTIAGYSQADGDVLRLVNGNTALTVTDIAGFKAGGAIQANGGNAKINFADDPSVNSAADQYVVLTGVATTKAFGATLVDVPATFEFI